MVLIMLVSYKCVCPGDLISANNAAIIRPPYCNGLQLKAYTPSSTKGMHSYI